MQLAHPTLLLVLATLSPLAAQGYTWLQSPVNGRHYALTTPMNWTQAEAEAQRLGGHLATIRTAAENAWVASSFSSGLECIWIGLNDAQTEGAFVWSSGEPVTYLNWGATEPSNGNGIEDWVSFGAPWSGPQHFDRWNDLADTNPSYGAVCRGVIECASIPPSVYTTFGSGCAGPVGVPSLQPVAGEPPRIGWPSRLRLSNLPQAVVVPLFVLGLSTTHNTGPLGAYPLPLDLSGLGLPGCRQYVSDDSVTFLLALTGQVDWSIYIPSEVGFVGMAFHVQALVPTSSQGFAVSNAVTGLVGF